MNHTSNRCLYKFIVRIGFSSLVLCIFLFSFLSKVQAQDNLSSDELFQMARKSAFDQKDYPKAIRLSKEALAKAPDYSDIRTFLGRIYTWTDHNDSARAEFSYVLKQHPDNEDAASAFTDLEYWNNNYLKALQYCNQGLQYHPESEDLLLKKGKILNATKKYKEAYLIIDSLLQKDPKNTQARSLINSIKNNASVHKIGVSYDYVYFDKQFNDPWNLVSLSYSQPTNIGSIIGRINYANRFLKNAVQGEIDFYPHISKTFYAYLNIGASGTNSVFPQFRSGASLYANLPWSMEAEAGFRYLHFTSNVWMYTASLGKYYRNFWFNLRTYLVPDNSNVSQSYTLTTRYYTGGSDDYIYLALGTGISPDDQAAAALLGSLNKLKSQKVATGFSHVFKKRNILSLDLTWYHQEYKTNTFGNQYDIGFTYQRRF
ncbi:YaiO family outer membrane beta-barrel protein [Arachidicoccus sp.]|uniref:YaiO family outer membrane beta-barrel protein n=1 Tax=Arachidicoccus sp. TaxID=1872624 RepID=UPI003D1D3C44